MESQDETPKTEYVEDKLKALREQIDKMEKENEELFETLAISPHQVQGVLNDKNLFSKEVYEFIQKERQALEASLDARLEEIRQDHYKEHPPETPQIGGHWIFVR